MTDGGYTETKPKELYPWQLFFDAVLRQEVTTLRQRYRSACEVEERALVAYKQAAEHLNQIRAQSNGYGTLLEELCKLFYDPDQALEFLPEDSS